MKLERGASAPFFEAEDSHEHTWRFPDDFKDKKLVLVFLRHLGCPLCKRRIDELKKDYLRFKESGAELMVIVDSTRPRVEKYADGKSIPYPLVWDKEKRIYSAYGVERGGLKAFLAPRVLKASLSATLKGYLHGPILGSELQKPAEFIIDKSGKVVWAHYGEDISDSTPNETLLRELSVAK